MRKIAVLAGDGIGPELMQAGMQVLRRAATRSGHHFTLAPGLVGWAAFDKYGDTMPEETWKICHDSHAILFGAVGLPDRDHEVALEYRPERRALLAIRRKFGLGCNIRPVTVYPGLEERSPLKNHLASGVKIVFFRELLGGEYFGKKRQDPAGEWAEDTCRYERWQIVDIARAAFTFAQRQNVGVVSVDKANVLVATGTFWREVVTQVHDKEFADVPLQHEYVDAFNAYLFTRPADFRVVLTSNMFGDVLSDGGAAIPGSIGMLPSASLNCETGMALYEPGGGSAPTIAGKGIANPVAMFLSIALLFTHTFKDEAAATAIEEAVKRALQRVATPDIGGENTTHDVVHAVLEELD